MTQIPYETPPLAPIGNRSGMLMVVGILLIVMGAIAGCVGLLAPFALLVPQPSGAAGPRARDVVMGAVMYALVAAIFIALGVGSIRKRRWVRPLVLVLGWIWLCAGVGGLVFWLFALPDMGTMMSARRPAGTPPMPAGFVTALSAGMTVFMAILYLGIPGTLILCFKGQEVRTTLEFYDQEARWTDRCPIVVLGLSAILALGAAWMLMMLPQGIFPAFGGLMTGTAARIALLVMATLFGAVAWQVYKLRPAGWWLAMVLLIAAPLSAAITLTRTNLIDLYRAAGMSEQQLEMIRNMRMLDSAFFAIWLAITGVVTIAYAVWVRRYFPRASGD